MDIVEGTTNPRVSVVIPTYNRSAYVRQAIESVLAQSYRAFEIVVSDNCSSDGTELVVRGFRDPLIHYFRNDRNIGMVPNWNAGIRRARAGYIALLEDDNWWHRSYLERAVQTLEAHPQVAFVHTTAFLTDQDRKSLGLRKRWGEDRLCDGLSELRELIQKDEIVLSTVTFRHDCLHSVGLFDETIPYAADWEMWLRLYVRYPAAYLAEPLAFYRVHEGRTTPQWRSQPSLPFYERRQVIEKTLDNVRAVYGDNLAGDLRRLSYRGMAEWQLDRAWDFHRAGALVLARREAALAVKCAPIVVFRFPLKFSIIFLTSFLPQGIGRSFLTFEQRVIRYLRSGFRGPW